MSCWARGQRMLGSVWLWLPKFATCVRQDQNTTVFTTLTMNSMQHVAATVQACFASDTSRALLSLTCCSARQFWEFFATQSCCRSVCCRRRFQGERVFSGVTESNYSCTNCCTFVGVICSQERCRPLCNACGGFIRPSGMRIECCPATLNAAVTNRSSRN